METEAAMKAAYMAEKVTDLTAALNMTVKVEKELKDQKKTSDDPQVRRDLKEVSDSAASIRVQLADAVKALEKLSD